MINIALYQPDIPQNTAAIIRLAGCLNLKVHIIEPCGFNLEDPRFKRVAMDYIKLSKVEKYKGFEKFLSKNLSSRIILMTTKSNKSFSKFRFKKNDFLLFGRESAGVPKEIYDKLVYKLKIPMYKKARSLNVATSAAITVSLALNQINYFK
jgi:tRNA (cytidine/uridine-2'-O-)-methyltransferase